MAVLGFAALELAVRVCLSDSGARGLRLGVRREEPSCNTSCRADGCALGCRSIEFWWFVEKLGMGMSKLEMRGQEVREGTGRISRACRQVTCHHLIPLSPWHTFAGSPEHPNC